jgi:hypothetical protein
MKQNKNEEGINSLKKIAKERPRNCHAYFQPFLNGIQPDLLILNETIGLIIILNSTLDLELCSIDENNRWLSETSENELISPFYEVTLWRNRIVHEYSEVYIERFFDNINFRNRIKTFVFFPGATQEKIERFFKKTDMILQEKRQDFKNQRKDNQIGITQYESEIAKLSINKGKVKLNQEETLFDNNFIDTISDFFGTQEEIQNSTTFFNLKGALNSGQVMDQSRKLINWGNKQRRLTQSQPNKTRSFGQRIIGESGTGKTLILAQRAINAYKRHNEPVLILTYNITLRKGIREKIEFLSVGKTGKYVIDHYHQFIFSNAKRFHKRVHVGNIDSVLYKICNQLPKYKTILIDEIQDYSKEWLLNISKYFLDNGGEMLICGDSTQNVYRTDLAAFNHIGKKEKLIVDYRAKGESTLASLVKDYAKFVRGEEHVKPSNTVMELPGLENVRGFIFTQLENIGIDLIVKKIIQYITGTSTQPSFYKPENVCIISEKIFVVRKIEKRILDCYPSQIEIQTTFESEDFFQKVKAQAPYLSDQNTRKFKFGNESEYYTLDEYCKVKKMSFSAKSNKLSLTTVKSAKGLEFPIIIFIIDKNDSKELIYTGISRAREQLMFFIHEESNSIDFFNDKLDTLSTLDNS